MGGAWQVVPQQGISLLTEIADVTNESMDFDFVTCYPQGIEEKNSGSSGTEKGRTTVWRCGIEHCIFSVRERERERERASGSHNYMLCISICDGDQDFLLVKLVLG